MPAQLRLTLQRPPDYTRAAFIHAASNAAGVRAIETWRDWPGGAMVLVGPSGSGKTHLATLWAERVGAVVLAADAQAAGLPPSPGPVLLEDADRTTGGEVLFHLINRAALPHGSLLITARRPPSAWTTDVADLRSRLNALPVSALDEPDDAVLRGLLRKFFAERNIRPPLDLLSYLTRRIERSSAAAFAVVERLDEVADAQRRPISRALAIRVLGRDAPMRDRAGVGDKNI